ncbi:MAG: bifunctional 4-hydroxy-2-oxoglutarate aldolase/2-dehydro-3-deoxy-phosphogluconate aldolase [Granulicella sp.]
MEKHKVIERIRQVGVLPVLRASSADLAMRLADAIAEGGISALEVTMTVPKAIGVIRKLVEQRPDLLIGAGTVLDPETARICILEGAEFIVSPTLNEATVRLCRRYSVAVLSGALTPSEVLRAWEAGSDIVKVFPASAMGGAKYLKSLKAPLPQVELIPTGGVSVATAKDFLEAGAFALGVGADLANEKAVAEGRASVVTEIARQYAAIVGDFRAASSGK